MPADLLTVHRDLLERFRRSMNLVGPGPVAEHFDDCALALATLEPEASGLTSVPVLAFRASPWRPCGPPCTSI